MDAMVLANKPMISLSTYGCPPWTDIENIIQRCLNANPGMTGIAVNINFQMVGMGLRTSLKLNVFIMLGDEKEYESQKLQSSLVFGL